MWWLLGAIGLPFNGRSNYPGVLPIGRDRNQMEGIVNLELLKSHLREIPGKYLHILEIMRRGLIGGEMYLKKRPSAEGKVQPISSKFYLESTIKRMCSAPRTEYTILSLFKHQPETHSTSSHTNDHSCQKFYWSLPLIVSLSITSPLSSYEWVNMIIIRAGRNENRIPYLPSHLQIDRLLWAYTVEWKRNCC